MGGRIYLKDAILCVRVQILLVKVKGDPNIIKSYTGPGTECVSSLYSLRVARSVKLPPDSFALASPQSVFTMSPVSSHTLCLSLTKPASAGSLSASTTPKDTIASGERPASPTTTSPNASSRAPEP